VSSSIFKSWISGENEVSSFFSSFLKVLTKNKTEQLFAIGPPEARGLSYESKFGTMSFLFSFFFTADVVGGVVQFSPRYFVLFDSVLLYSLTDKVLCCFSILNFEFMIDISKRSS